MKDRLHKINLGLFAYLILLVAFFFFVYPIYPNREDLGLFQWLSSTWNSENDFVHGWAVPLLFLVFCIQAWKEMRKEELRGALSGLLLVAFGALCYLVSMRTMQPRIAFVGVPFLIVGGVAYTSGWARARHMLFPAFFWYLAVPVPGLQHATNFLQLFVSRACYYTGDLMGMDLILSGNEIYSATNSWDFDIAEGCSGIRSLMALVMISAIYAYYTQKTWLKRAVLFTCALPLAMLGNYIRVFSILVLAELGFAEFAGGFYHDFSGIILFFPVALLGLFLIGHLLGGGKLRRRVKTRVVS